MFALKWHQNMNQKEGWKRKEQNTWLKAFSKESSDDGAFETTTQ